MLEKLQKQHSYQAPAQICFIAFEATLYYTILYYTILYYTILYYTILYFTIRYFTILQYTITVLYCIMLYYVLAQVSRQSNHSLDALLPLSTKQGCMGHVGSDRPKLM